MELFDLLLHKSVAGGGSGGGGSSSWSHQQFTHTENWTTSESGNTQNFYNTYLSGTVGKVVIVLISNNTATGNNKAVRVVGINSTGYSVNANYKALFFGRLYETNAIASNYDFYLSAGSVIDIYTSDMPNGG